MNKKNTLKFTGERFVPECQREIWYEHVHRYGILQPFVSEKKVLDAACGEGYGSKMIAQWAKSVVGVDIDEVSVRHAAERYQYDNLKFECCDVLDLSYQDNSFDVVVSFETLEHLLEHDELLSEFQRVLKPDGYLIISTPDKAQYSDMAGFNNEFHVKELYRHEYKELLDRFFPFQQWFGQKLSFFSTIWNLDKSILSASISTYNETDEIVEKHFDEAPMYFIVVASRVQLRPIVDECSLFKDSTDSVYAHYNEMVRGFIDASEKYQSIKLKHETWKKHPFWGRVIRWLERKDK